MARLSLIVLSALTLAGCPRVTPETQHIVYITVPGYKPVYRIKLDSDGFVGRAYPTDFVFTIVNNTVTVEGQPWTGHICSTPVVYADGTKCHEIVWDNPTNSRDIALANEIAWSMCDLNGYVVPID